ncbi:MAG: hypothetical protein QNK04_34230 [Myxococcota bacterium]|nr:hypothetical protein [Myxococcota bacterium]
MSPKLPDIDEVLREALKHGIGGIHPDTEQLKTWSRATRTGPSSS